MSPRRGIGTRLARRVASGGPELLCGVVGLGVLVVLVLTGVLPWFSLVVAPIGGLLSGLLAERLQRGKFEHSEGDVLCATRLVEDGPPARWQYGWLIRQGHTLTFHPRGSPLTHRNATLRLPAPLPPGPSRPPTWREGWTVDAALRIVTVQTVDDRTVELAVRPQDQLRLGRADGDGQATTPDPSTGVIES